MKQAHAGFRTIESHHVGPVVEHRSMGWLAVVVAVAILAIFVLGAMAEDRWCGPELCVEDVMLF